MTLSLRRFSMSIWDQQTLSWNVGRQIDAACLLRSMVRDVPAPPRRRQVGDGSNPSRSGGRPKDFFPWSGVALRPVPKEVTWLFFRATIPELARLYPKSRPNINDRSVNEISTAILHASYGNDNGPHGNGSTISHRAALMKGKIERIFDFQLLV